jgi:hypothetical protein
MPIFYLYNFIFPIISSGRSKYVDFFTRIAHGKDPVLVKKKKNLGLRATDRLGMGVHATAAAAARPLCKTKTTAVRAG